MLQKLHATRFMQLHVVVLCKQALIKFKVHQENLFFKNQPRELS
jgi:hypothetical protein